ncbi:MAG: hypothetical protein Q9184_005247 [Pyrenodesmia sp. 2 TL-2023]
MLNKRGLNSPCAIWTLEMWWSSTVGGLNGTSASAGISEPAKQEDSTKYKDVENTTQPEELPPWDKAGWNGRGEKKSQQDWTRSMRGRILERVAR